MLNFDPAKRITCEQALEHPYLAVWHDPSDEPICPTKFDFGFEAEENSEGMKKLIIEEVNLFRSEVRAQARANQAARSQPSNLPIPSRDDIISSPIQQNAPHNGATGYYTNNDTDPNRVPSPVMEDPSADLERELEQTHLGRM
jgi:serine/threonine protein kinase